MKSLRELVNTEEPAIAHLREWAAASDVPCQILPASAEREATLVGLQVTTRSILGALAYETGGVLLDHGWLRFIGSGSDRLSRRLDSWNQGRSEGFFLVADDAVGGFFAINGGGLGPDLQSMYYWGPDDLDWMPLELGLAALLERFLEQGLAKFYEALRWPGWQSDVADLPSDRCYVFYPFLWTKEGSLLGSHRSVVPASEAFDAKTDMVRQLRGGGA